MKMAEYDKLSDLFIPLWKLAPGVTCVYNSFGMGILWRGHSITWLRHVFNKHENVCHTFTTPSCKPDKITRKKFKYVIQGYPWKDVTSVFTFFYTSVSLTNSLCDHKSTLILFQSYIKLNFFFVRLFYWITKFFIQFILEIKGKKVFM